MPSSTAHGFGSLGDRSSGTSGRTDSRISSQGRGRAATVIDRAGRTSWVEVDDGGWLPGLLVSWSRSPAGWLALVAWVAEGHLKVASVPSNRVRPVTPAGPEVRDRCPGQ